MAHAGIASRRASEKMILDGRVVVNGQVVTELGTKVAEGYYTAACVRELSATYEVDMPIAEGVYRALYEGATIKEIIAGFMERPLRAE